MSLGRLGPICELSLRVCLETPGQKAAHTRLGRGLGEMPAPAKVTHLTSGPLIRWQSQPRDANTDCSCSAAKFCSLIRKSYAPGSLTAQSGFCESKLADERDCDSKNRKEERKCKQPTPAPLSLSLSLLHTPHHTFTHTFFPTALCLLL